MSDARPAVLLVDDHPENLVALEATLTPLDCELLSAGSGAEALRHLLERDVAVILLDVQMPEMDGFETARYIKERERTRAIPIIFVTAISKDSEHVFAGYEAGAVDYLFKPYEPELVRSKVAVFLELWRTARERNASEGLARATFEWAPIGMARLAGDGRIEAANRALCDTLGRDRHELVGLLFADLVHASDRDADAAQRERLQAGELERYTVEQRLLGPGGAALPALVSVSTIGSEDAGDGARLAQVSDLSERRRAERQRELLVREQAARVQAEAVSERLAALQRVADAALAPLPLDDLLAELLGRIAEVLAVDTALVVLRAADGDRLEVVQADEGVDVAVRRRFVEPGEHGIVARIARHRAPVIVDDVAREEGLGAALAGEALSSLLAVPLLAEDTVLGALVVGTLFERVFTTADADLLQVAADRAAGAIERARLFEREHRIAQLLQRALLPDRLPSVPGLRLAARYLPGGAGTEVGGDWYDALELPGGRLALVMGDVAGRGVGAAATMGQLRSALRAYALEGGSPAEVLTRLNRFQLLLGTDAMATVVLLVLDPEGGRVHYASAGHLPPIVVGPDGAAEFLDEARDPPLGALDDATFQEAEAALAPGTTVVLYTDGLIERPGESLDAGFARLREAVRSAGGHPEELCEAILGGTLGAATSSDDVTFVVANSPAVLGEHVSLSLPGESRALRTLRTTLRRWLAEQEASAAEVDDITMAANEAVENAIEHAHGLRTTPFEVELEREGADVVVTVRDSGRWHEHANGDRGRGLPLMRSLVDDVGIEPRRAGTTVVLRRRLDGPPADV